MKVSVVACAFALVFAAMLPLVAEERSGQHSQKPMTAAHGQHINSDSDYVNMMLMHHKHGIEMARAVIDRGESEEVKGLARKIMDGQQRDSKELENLKQKLAGGTGGAEGTSGRDSHAPQMSHDSGAMNRQMMDEQAEKLRSASGAEADKLFVDLMTRHHQQAIAMTNAAMPKLKEPDVRQLAAKMVETQKKEVAELKALK